MYRRWKGKRALVTGASGGIGEEISRQLAAAGVHLVLTARREEQLKALALELTEKHEIEATVIPCDLQETATPSFLYDETEGKDVQIDILINNAGFGNHGDFSDIPGASTAAQIQVNITALTELTRLFLVSMKSRKSGWILNVASVGGFLPVPGYATYGAGKAYVKSFTEAVAQECRGTGVSLTALCPGPIRTDFAKNAGHQLTSLQELAYAPVAPCARAALRGLHRGKTVVVPGFLMKISTFFLLFIPRRFAAWLAGILMK